MSLEEIIKNIKRKALPWVLSSAILGTSIMGSGCDALNPFSSKKKNKAPETTIEEILVSKTDQGDNTIYFQAGGEDRDGTINYFEYKIENSERYSDWQKTNTGTVRIPLPDGHYRLMVRAIDNDGEADPTPTETSLTMNTSERNNPPQFLNIIDKEIDEGQTLTFTTTAIDPDGDLLEYSTSTLPEEATFREQTFTWTPNYNQAGTYEVIFRVNDGEEEDILTTRILVNDVPELITEPVEIVEIPLETASEESNLEITNVFQTETNEEGLAAFIDTTSDDGNSTISILNEETQEPIENAMQVVYYDNPEFKVFRAYDPTEEYLPTMGVFLHNSLHILKTRPLSDFGVIHTQRIETRSGFRALYRWETTNIAAGWWREWEYEDTIDETERIERRDTNLAIIRLIDLTMPSVDTYGASLPITLENLAQYLDPYRDKAESKRWDIYRQRHGTRYSEQTGDIELIPSNTPTLELRTEINRDQVTLTFDAFDDTVYDMPFGLPDKEDITILLGPTNQPDLTFHYTLTKDRQLIEERNTNERNITLFELDSGNYDLEARVTDEVGNVSSPDYSSFTIEEIPVEPLENKIIWGSGYQIYIMDPNGSNVKVIKDLRGYFPKISPDGMRIAFMYEGGGIAVANINGKNLVRLTEDEGAFPSWSPSGDRIVFVKQFEDGTDLSTIDIESDRIERITYEESARDPSWKYHPNRIVFSATNRNRQEIFTYNVFTREIEQITRYNDRNKYTPSWSPDLTKIAYTEYSSRSVGFPSRTVVRSEIFLIDVETRETTRLTHYGARFNPSWSPDGSKIIFSGLSDKDYDIYSISPNGEDETNLTNTFNFNEYNPDWTFK